MSLYVDIEKKINGFDFKVKIDTDSNLLGILGSSGSGKTMTLKCISGIIKPDRGKIVVDGRVLFDSENNIDIPTQKRNIGYLFQNYALFPNMSVKNNILSGVKKDVVDKDKLVRKLLKLFRLDGLENRKPNQLSGGQQQRVALARLLAMEPDIILLDEPFSALDSNLKEYLHVEIQKIFNNYHKPILLVSHDRDEIFRFCDEIVIINNGKDIRCGKVEEVFSNPISVEVANLIGIKNIYPLKKIDEYNVIIEKFDTIFEVDKEVGNSSNIAIRARDVNILLDESEFGNKNIIPIDVVSVSKGFSFITVLCTVKNCDENAFDNILVKVPCNLWRDEYLSAKFVKFEKDKIFVLN